MSFRYDATTNTIESVESGTSLKLLATAAGVKIPVLAADPVSPANGELYYNSVSNTYRLWQNSSWIVVPNDVLVAHLAGTETFTGDKTFSGTVNMAGSPAVTVPPPGAAGQAATKAYVDSLVTSGIVWKNPIRDPDVQDVVSTDPSVGLNGTLGQTFTFIKFGGVQGEVWNAGGITATVSDGNVAQVVITTAPSTGNWSVIQPTLAAGDRYGLAFEHGTITPTSALYAAGFRHGDLVQYVSGDPTLFGSWTTPSDGGYQIIDFTSPKVAADVTTLVDATIYDLNVEINGTNHNITVTADASYTFGELATDLSTALNAAYLGASVVLEPEGHFHVFSGDGTKVIISEGTGTDPLLDGLTTDFNEIRAGIVNGTTVVVSDPDSLHHGHTYSYSADGNAWTEISGGAVTPPGADTWIIFNDAGAFGADTNLTYNKADGHFYVNTTDGITGSVSVVSPGKTTIFGAYSSGTAAGGDARLIAGSGGPTGGDGGILLVAGGDGVAVGANGGDATITAGAAGDGNGGNIFVFATDGAGTSRNGGSVNITAGIATGSGTSGAITITAGTGGITSGGGSVSITAGSGGAISGDGDGGSVSITAGSGGAISGAGGLINIQAGTTTNGSGGQIAISAASGAGSGDFDGGYLTVTAGDGVGAGFGGYIDINAGNNTTGTGIGGEISIRAGASTTTPGQVRIQSGDGVNTNNGANVLIAAGSGGVTSGNGGDTSVSGGSGIGTGNGGNTSILGGPPSDGAGGNVFITAATGAGAAGNGGGVTIAAGAPSGTGTTGVIGHVTTGGYEYQRSGNFSVAGDAQSNMYVLRTQTTNNTTTEMFLDGTGGTRRMVLPNDTTWKFEVNVVARRADVDNESAAFTVDGAIDRNTNAASTATVGSVTPTIVADDSGGAWTVTVDADTTNGTLRIQVTGETAKTIRWVAFVRTVETTG